MAYRDTYITLWDSTVPSGGVNTGDTYPLVLATRFQFDVESFVVGLRYYHSHLDGNDHWGLLWDAAGHVLRQVPSVRNYLGAPLVDGWQHTYFRDWWRVAASTAFYAGWFYPFGYYAFGPNAVAAGPKVNGHLRALQDGSGGFANGLYRYGAYDFALPVNSYSSTLYGVDVLARTA